MDQLLDLAIQNRLVTRKQAEMVREEAKRSPGETLGQILLRKRYVTREQLNQLEMHLGLPPTEPGKRHNESTIVLPPKASDVRQQHGAPQGGGGAAPARSAPAAPAQGPTSQPVAAKTAAVPAAAPEPVIEVSRDLPEAGDIIDLLRIARHWGCSDLHIVSGRPPFVRLGGTLRFMETKPLTAAKSEELNFSGLTEYQAELARHHQNIDFALDLPELGRYRCNIFKERLGWAGSYRIVRGTVPSIEELGLPPVCKTLTEYHQGMVLVTGASGSGKTTTVAAMLSHVNRTREDHIITVEDPIEYVHRPIRCQVTQREVGRHTESFAKALRAALREDPDIMLVGELRDLDTISISISAAETGHLVFGTLHTSSAARTVSRILDVFPPNQQQQVCTMISESIRGVISQQLVPRLDGTGRALALEVLIFTSGVSQLVREGKTFQISSQIQAGKKYGMILMDDSLMSLYQQGIISGAEAYARAENKGPFELIKEA